MTIEHNVVVVGGIEFKAVNSVSVSCENCAGEKNSYHCLLLRQQCADHQRIDNTEVIFKRHYRPTHKELQNLNLDIEVQND